MKWLVNLLFCMPAIWCHAQAIAPDSLWLVTDSITVHDVSGASSTELYRRACAYANIKHPTSIITKDTVNKIIAYAVRCVGLGSEMHVVHNDNPKKISVRTYVRVTATITIHCYNGRYELHWKYNPDAIHSFDDSAKNPLTFSLSRDWVHQMLAALPNETARDKRRQTATLAGGKRATAMLNFLAATKLMFIQEYITNLVQNPKIDR